MFDEEDAVTMESGVTLQAGTPARSPLEQPEPPAEVEPEKPEEVEPEAEQPTEAGSGAGATEAMVRCTHCNTWNRGNGVCAGCGAQLSVQVR
ncbi:MAG TPA: hypothetical protein VGD54_07570 [Steroidobacteraceae bacterium]